MPFDGAGNFTRTPGTRISNAGPLVSAQVNDETDNLVTGINGKVNLDGKLAMTGLQTLFGDGTAALHPATVQQAQKGIVEVATAVAGTVDAIQITMSPASTTWTTKEKVEWVSAGPNTIATPTISKDGGVTNKTIVTASGGALAIGATGAAGVLNRGYYDGTNVRLLSSTSFTGGTLTSTTSMSSKAFNEAKGAAVASAATTDIWTNSDGNFLHITGTTTITSFGTAPQAGAERVVIFDGALTLTHNATSLILPGAANITTAAGDRMIVRADTTANMTVIAYTKASGQPIVSGTSTNQATTSGTSVLFSGIPAGVTKIFVSFNGVSTTGTSPVMVQLGAGSVTSTGYLGSATGAQGGAGTVNHSSGFQIYFQGTDAATYVRHGVLTLVNVTGNTWAMSGVISVSNTNYTAITSGSVPLSGTLDRVNITTVGGTDTFDAGSVSVRYEF